MTKKLKPVKRTGNRIIIGYLYPTVMFYFITKVHDLQLDIVRCAEHPWFQIFLRLILSITIWYTLSSFLLSQLVMYTFFLNRFRHLVMNI